MKPLPDIREVLLEEEDGELTLFVPFLEGVEPGVNGIADVFMGKDVGDGSSLIDAISLSICSSHNRCFSLRDVIRNNYFSE